MIRIRGPLACALLALLPAMVPAATPPPGGADQVKAVSAPLGTTAFNGVLRIKITDLKYTTDPADLNYFNPGNKVMKFTALLRNGAKDNFIDLLQYTLADKDDVTVAVPTNTMHPANLNILQGSAARQTMIFVVDPSFVPVKLIVTCLTCGSRSAFRNVRFTIATPPQ